ncbi:MAG TPA: hypothetical protein VL752_12765 [Acidisoma sp.]|uniref:ArnT family glycosyltransferase n=1 Tax=Acidisoma sp. TaxID=1872115 RepID=UPI002C0EC163|nr:hypothetical protein [Acidisoma sp.]HTI01810.1 hypothetical protein [Acidisoma sp.]
MTSNDVGLPYRTEAVSTVASNRLVEGAFLVAGILTAIYAVTSLALPFGWDQGMMASVGSSWVHGGVPYVTGWEIKGPISFVPYALAQLLFGPTMWGVRIFDVLMSAAASCVFYAGIRSLTNWQVGAWATIGFYYWIASAGWFYTAAPDPWAGFLCVMAIVPLVATNKALSGWRLLLSGFLIGCIGLIKPLYLLAGIAPLLSVALVPRLTGKRRAGLAFVLAIGAAAPIMAMYGYLAWRGGLSQVIEAHILYPLSTYAHVSVGTTPVQGFANFFARPTVALMTPFIGLGIWEFRKQPQLLWPVLGWLAALLVIVVAQGKYFPAHWLPVYAPLVFLAALGAHALARDDRKAGASRIVAFGAALMFTVQVCAPPFYDATKCIYYLDMKHAPDRYYASFEFFHVYNAEDERAAASYIAGRTSPEDGVFIWGNDATVRYLANRPNPSRFTYEMPLSLPGRYLARYRVEVMHELRARPPTYFIVGINWWGADSKAQALGKFSALAAFLNQGYSLEKSFGALDLYRRNATP